MSAQLTDDVRAESLTDVQGSLRALLGTRYQLIAHIRRPADGHAGDAPWRAYLAEDTSLRRKVVLRVWTPQPAHPGTTISVHGGMRRAMLGARLSTHLVAQVYDAVLAPQVRDESSSSPAAVVVAEHFAGPRLPEAGAVDGSAMLAALTERIAELTAAGVSFGALRPESVVVTSSGPAIAALPRGTVDELGPTQLHAIADHLASARGEGGRRQVHRDPAGSAARPMSALLTARRPAHSV